ncbi:EpsG family protein [Sphingobacterium spiritivorum]|uniref:EpsG family protein n=1 Tax=Sphingobacterium spiritivorum TaxID=258 RepID=UPI003DA507F9
MVEINLIYKQKYQTIYQQSARLILILVIGLIGFRWQTGTDWDPYYQFFRTTYGRDFFAKDSYMDYGYVLFNNFVYLINNSYTSLLLIHAIVFYYCIYRSYKFFTPYVILSFFLYVTITYGMTGSNRQLLAVALGFMALVNYLKENYIKAAIFLGLAFLSHSSSLLLLCYPFFNRKIQVKYIIIVFIVGFALGQSGVISNLFSFVGGGLDEASDSKVDAYMNYSDSTTSLSVIGILRRVVTVFLLLYFSKSLRRRYQYFDLCLNSYLFTVLAFGMFSAVPIIAGRGMLFFNVMEPILLVYLVSLLDKYKLEKIGYAVMCVLIIFFFFQSINLFPDLFLPYKGIFINTDFYRYIH